MSHKGTQTIGAVNLRVNVVSRIHQKQVKRLGKNLGQCAVQGQDSAEVLGHPVASGLT